MTTPIDTTRLRERAEARGRRHAMKAPQEAQCPECERWSPVSYQYLDALDPIGGFWWAPTDGSVNAGCPACGQLVLVESECNFRDRMIDVERAALDARVESAVLAQLGGVR